MGRVEVGVARSGRGSNSKNRHSHHESKSPKQFVNHIVGVQIARWRMDGGGGRGARLSAGE